MKKYLVIGNPINHSLSPKLHNYWLNKHEINAVYEKKEINDDELEAIILDIKNEKIHGINVTVPFKKLVIPHLDELTTLACLLYTSPSPRDGLLSRMPSSA